MTLPLIYDLDLEELRDFLVKSGEPNFRAIQIWEGLYKHYWQNPEEFTNLPKSLRSTLSNLVNFETVTPIIKLDSADRRTQKTLFKLQDSLSIEAVLMHYDRRQTLCISTQAGCAMGCVFCATGQMGFKRHLSSGEIVAQVMHYARLLAHDGTHVTNIVVMGMGEPFHNYANTLSAIDRLNNSEGYNFGARRFTISTSGLVPAIRRFADERRQINLAVSLHAVDDDLRSSMMPVNKKYAVDEVIDACHYYIDRTGRRITFEWALIEGVNDTPDQAVKLSRKLKGMLCHVNAIPLNPTIGYSGKAATHERAEVFKEILNKAGIPCTVRIRRGIDIQAGCGQLAVEVK